MADSAFELQQFGYHLQSGTDRAITQNVDEMTISNMLTVLRDPVLRSLLSEDELRMVLETVKNHVVIKAQMINDIQNKKLQSIEVGKSFK